MGKGVEIPNLVELINTVNYENLFLKVSQKSRLILTEYSIIISGG